LEPRKHRDLVRHWCVGCGVDVGCGIDPITPHAVRIDGDASVAHLHGDARDLYWFKDGVLDYVHASHILEDFALEEWDKILAEWGRVLKPGGRLIIAVPEHERFRAAVRSGQMDNLGHKHEPAFGEVEQHLPGWKILMTRYVSENDYSMIIVAEKPA
jgi:predicted SAM-dependent methyltransferase